jgi:hypothetical protein
MLVYSFSGVGSVGTYSIVGGSGPGTRTASVTISSNDMVLGAIGVAVLIANLTMNESNTATANDVNNYIAVGADTNTGSGSVSVSATITSNPSGSEMAAIPILAPAISVNSNFLMFM